MADYIDKHGLVTLWQRIKDYVSTAISGIEGATPSSTTPKEDGDATAGEETAFARGDHRHPHDTSKVDKVDGKGLSSNDYTDTDKQKVDAIPSNWSYVTYIAGDGINIENGVISATGGGGEENVIEVVKVNGESLNPDANKAVNISVPNVPNWALQESKPSYDYSEIGNTPTIPIVPANVSAFNNDAGYLTQHQDLSNYVQKSNTSGLLKNDGTVDTTQYGTYSKPSGGIPASDIASGVIPDGIYILELLQDEGTLTQEQIALVQSDHCIIVFDNEYYYKNYVEGNSLEYILNYIDGTDYGIGQKLIEINISDGSYSVEDHNLDIQSDWNESDSTSVAYIKNKPTIPNTSGLAPKIPITNHGTSDTTFTLTPNVFHVWGQVSSLTLTLDTASATYLDEFMFQFESGSTATTLNLPQTVKVIGTIEANKTYQCSIVNNLAVIGGA